MKVKYWWLIVTLYLLTVNVNAQEWRQVLTENGASFSALYFVNNTTGWYVGDDGYVGKTEDGGETVTDLNAGITEDLEAVFFIDADTGFVGGDDYFIYKTTDGGQSWSSIPVPDSLSGGTIYGIYFANSLKGWVMSSTSKAGQVVYTTDGGTNWEIVVDSTMGDLEAMDFYDDESGIVVGGGSGKMDIFYTKDGSTWTGATLPDMPSTINYSRTDLKGIDMYSKDVAYVVGWGSTSGAQPSIHLKTTDGGATWTYLEQTDANKTYANLYDVYFKDENNGIAIGGGAMGSIAVRTSDGGANWIPIDIPCGATLTGIKGSQDDVFVVGNSEIRFSSNDFGDTWELLTDIPSATIYSLSAVSDNIIYAAGSNGTIFKSTNGGNDWEAGFVYDNKVAPNIQKIYFVNENVGYAGHSYSMVSKTTDGGETWEAVINDTAVSSVIRYGLYFFDENTGFVVGKSGNDVDVIYKTTDGGASWTLTTGIAEANLRSVAFANTQIGAVVAEDMKILYTSDGGSNWQLATITDVPEDLDLYDVVFTSSTDAVAVGNDVILKTTDGGANWKYVAVEGLGHKLNGVKYNNDELWAVGYSSSKPKDIGLFKSTDSGSTWSVEDVDYDVMDSTKSVNDIALTPSGYIFLAGNSTNIYTNSSVVSAVDDEETIAESFKLNQNYPNPFNPSTYISYEINSSSEVELKVYDILGREVATLVNELQTAGSYKIAFNPAVNKLSSGVYFYQLKTGTLVQTKKMVYLK
ncbi:MAG: YCF48-related protein [Ignavibacteria bacterium]|jgi:photosystem II stability/assembly factor-like uncharacterized protein